MNFSHLREALSRPPHGYVAPRPTSVPRMSLEASIRFWQNRLRSPTPYTLRERVGAWWRCEHFESLFLDAALALVALSMLALGAFLAWVL